MRIWTTKNGYIIYQVLSVRSNVFLISNGLKCILVDTSVKNKWSSLKKGIDKICDSKQTLEAIIVTHAHYDHAANVSKVKEKYNAKVIIHRKEADCLLKGETSPPKGTVFFTKWFDVFGKSAVKLVKYNPSNYDLLVDDVYDMNEMGFDARIIHTPGHTMGSLSIIIDNEIALVGDTMFGIIKNSVLPFFADNPKALIKSWEKLLKSKCSYFLPSHGTANCRTLVQKQYNKYRQIYNK